MADRKIPKDKINLRLIMPAYGESGKAKDFLFSPRHTAADVAQYVFEHWPEDWADQAVPRPEILRLIFQGRFLHGAVQLRMLQLPLGKTTVMHLVPREKLPKVNSKENCSKSKDRSDGCCSCFGLCSIL